jgi:hypothetical protein
MAWMTDVWKGARRLKKFRLARRLRTFRLLSGLAVLACAGAALAFALAGPVGADTGTSTATSTDQATTAGPAKHGHKAEKTNHDQSDKPGKACRKVVLRGSGGSGSVTMTVAKASGPNNSALVGQPATLTVPANSTLHAVAVACTDAPGTLTLKQLVVSAPHLAASTSHAGS